MSNYCNGCYALKLNNRVDITDIDMLLRIKYSIFDTDGIDFILYGTSSFNVNKSSDI